MKPRLLDLFCGAGGAGRGYQTAGFHVTGIDRACQPRYAGDVFIQDDALEFLARRRHKFDVIHASPPCQQFTAYRRRGGSVGERFLNLIPDVRALLAGFDGPWIIENVPGAPLIDPIQLCGSSFGLDVRRHRLFESNIDLTSLPCSHGWQTPRFASSTNRVNLRRTVEVGVWRIPLAVQRTAMGIEWMELAELSQAIPPAYTEFLGRQALTALT